LPSGIRAPKLNVFIRRFKMKYLVKTHFSGWVEVTEEKFYGFRRLLRNTATAIPADKMDEYIESRTKIIEEEN
jgi:hypothetical protein